MILIIAEKPLSAKKIAEILGYNKIEYINKIPVWHLKLNSENAILIPLKGHIIDVDFPKEFQKWSFEVLKKLPDVDLIEKKSNYLIYSAIEEIVKKYNISKVIIATDNDREGESIGLEVVRSIFNNNIPIYRARFSAITKKDILKAFSNLDLPNENLASAAWARRDIDLYWGAALTRWLSLISNCRGKDFLSIGRVQTPTLKLVVDRELEILNFKPEIYYKLVYILENSKFTYPEKLDEKKGKELYEQLKGKSPTIKSQQVEESLLPRPTPFNTTEFLKEANALGFSADKAMYIAEQLYMKGYISYPRTDTNVYPESLNLEEKVNMLLETPYRDLALKVIPINKPSSGKSKKDDHPPIIPVGYGPMSEDEKKIYDLIVRRFLATLYKDARIKKTKIILDIDGCDFVGEFKEIVDKGWLEIYPKKVELS
jgi:DNA topoisomerase-1